MVLLQPPNLPYLPHTYSVLTHPIPHITGDDPRRAWSLGSGDDARRVPCRQAASRCQLRV